jgi:hypothetical protein
MSAILSGIVGGVTAFVLIWLWQYREHRKVRHLINALNEAQMKRNWRNN